MYLALYSWLILANCNLCTCNKIHEKSLLILDGAVAAPSSKPSADDPVTPAAPKPPTKPAESEPSKPSASSIPETLPPPQPIPSAPMSTQPLPDTTSATLQTAPFGETRTEQRVNWTTVHPYWKQLTYLSGYLRKWNGWVDLVVFNFDWLYYNNSAKVTITFGNYRYRRYLISSTV